MNSNTGEVSPQSVGNELDVSQKQPKVAPHAGLIAFEDEAHDNLCGICFTAIHSVENPRGRLNSCDHKFCSHCIKEWAEMTNVCPACKARFTRIFTVTAGHNQVTKVRKRNYKAWLEQEESQDEANEEANEDSALFLSQENDNSNNGTLGVNELSGRNSRPITDKVCCDVCHQCENATRIIFCDSRECMFAAHLDCLALNEHPLTFLCRGCTERRRSSLSGNASATLPGETQPESSMPADSTPLPSPPLPSLASPVTAPPRQSQRSRASKEASSSRATITPRGNSSASTTVGLSQRLTRGSGVNTEPQQRTAAVGPQNQAFIDFSKPLFLAAPPERTTEAEKSALSFASSGSGALHDDSYFLKPNRHSIQATKDLMKLGEAREYAIRARREHKAALQVYPQNIQRHHTHLRLEPRSRQYGDASWVKRVRHEPSSSGFTGPSSEEVKRQEVEAAVADLHDSSHRNQVIEQMARQIAVDILPVLRQKAHISENRLVLGSAGDILRAPLASKDQETKREKALWESAMKEARRMAEQQLNRRIAYLRAKREALVTAQAEREAAALAKLARIIASHRFGQGRRS